MLSPKSFFEKKCYVCVDSLDGLVSVPSEIKSVVRVFNTYVVHTDLGIFDIQSILIHDSKRVADSVCELYNQSKGGVTNEQEETSDQG